MAIRPGDYYMQCGDCGARQYRSDMKFSKEYNKFICNFHQHRVREEEFKEYKTHLATMTIRNHHQDHFRGEETHIWNEISETWDEIEWTWDS